jgi:hypothetical protein
VDSARRASADVVAEMIAANMRVIVKIHFMQNPLLRLRQKANILFPIPRRCQFSGTSMATIANGADAEAPLRLMPLADIARRASADVATKAMTVERNAPVKIRIMKHLHFKYFRPKTGICFQINIQPAPWQKRDTEDLHGPRQTRPAMLRQLYSCDAIFSDPLPANPDFLPNRISKQVS